jgi:decaprenyl-phosphate phosphoribosyltransferase
VFDGLQPSPALDPEPATVVDPEADAALVHDLAPEPHPTRRPPTSLGRGLVAQARPKQWVKNALVVVAPGAAGQLWHAHVLWRVVVAIIALCLVSSATYYLNDARDVAVDRQHPTKRYRPMAAGIVPLRLGYAVSLLLFLVGIAVAATIGWKLLVVCLVYVAITTSYSLYLKHIAVIELAAVAAGFVVRAVAGGVAAPVRISQWFLIVASFAALFVVAGKRHGEFVAVGGQQAATRASLRAYSLQYLRFVWGLAAAVTSLAYCLWAFEQSHGVGHPVLYQLSVLPFVLALLRYALIIEEGNGGAPEDALLGDRTLLVLGVAWVAVFGAGVILH